MKHLTESAYADHLHGLQDGDLAAEFMDKLATDQWEHADVCVIEMERRGIDPLPLIKHAQRKRNKALQEWDHTRIIFVSEPGPFLGWWVFTHPRTGHTVTVALSRPCYDSLLLRSVN